MLKTDVIAHFGSVKATCKALGITKAAVSAWKDIIPVGSAYKTQVITGGILQVNPNLYPPKKKPAQVAA
jgi:transcriptional repressor of cell division inhibition gene dicB